MGINLAAANGVGTLSNTTSGGALTFNNNGTLTVSNITASGATRIISSGDFTMAGDIDAGAGSLAIGSSGGNFMRTGGALNGDGTSAGGIVIYSDTLAGSARIENYIQYGASFPTPGLSAGIGLLLQEAPPTGTPPIVVTNPVVIVTEIPTVDIPTFSSTGIDVDLGDFLVGFLESDLSDIEIGVINIGNSNLQVSEELLAKLKEELSTEAKQDLLDAMRSLLDGGIDIREADLPEGLIYLENSRSESVVIPLSLFFEYLGRLLSEEEKKELLEAANTL